MTQQNLPVRVAVVEDDEPVLDAVTLVLENQEWEVRAYTNGEAFLDDLHDYMPDILLLDSHLPGIDGVEVIEHLGDKLVTLPIIILTAYPNSTETIRLHETAGSQLLRKPVTELELLSRCRAALKV